MNVACLAHLNSRASSLVEEVEAGTKQQRLPAKKNVAQQHSPQEASADLQRHPAVPASSVAARKVATARSNVRLPVHCPHQVNVTTPSVGSLVLGA